MSTLRPDNWRPLRHGFVHWPHGVAQRITFAGVEEPEFDRVYVSVHVETDYVREVAHERLSRAIVRGLAMAGVGGAPFMDGARIRLRSHLRLHRTDTDEALLAVDAAMAQAAITYVLHQAVDQGDADHRRRVRGVPDRTAHPELGVRLAPLETLAQRLQALEPQFVDRKPWAAMAAVAAVHRHFAMRRFTNLEGGDIDGWTGVRYDLEAVDLDAALASCGRDDGSVVAYARLDSGIVHPWFGSVLAFRTLVPVPNWLDDAEGDAWAERFSAAEFEPGAPRYVLGSWAFDRPLRRWVFTSVQPVVWTGPWRAAELLGDMGRRARWWLRTQRPRVLATREVPTGRMRAPQSDRA